MTQHIEPCPCGAAPELVTVGEGRRKRFAYRCSSPARMFELRDLHAVTVPHAYASDAAAAWRLEVSLMRRRYKEAGIPLPKDRHQGGGDVR